MKRLEVLERRQLDFEAGTLRLETGTTKDVWSTCRPI